MLNKVVYYWDFEEKEYKIIINGDQHRFILNHPNDLNALSDFLDSAGEWYIKEGKEWRALAV